MAVRPALGGSSRGATAPLPCDNRGVEAPSGTVTFLFTDIERSTPLWDRHPEAMGAALARHDRLLRDAVVGRGGRVFSSGGDGVGVAFARASDAVTAAVVAQRALQNEPWPPEVTLRVRMGLHSGAAEERDGNYYGAPLNRAARLMAAAHGGQIVVSDITAALAGRIDGVGLVDLGIHRFRGLAEPTRVFSVKADGVTWVDRPLATPDGWRGNLPRPLTEWFGPVAELTRRAGELGRRRLVTLTGPGGVGKTRLAIEAAGLVAEEFPDGLWMVELAALSDPAGVPAAVAAALGVAPQDGRPLVASLLDWLEQRRLLLILDNCEHVLGPVAELVGRVTESVDTVTVLVTSREPLGVRGERVLAVRSLTPEDATGLFCDRAAALDESLVFDDGQRQTIAAIGRRLDGIPLAIELAAARARTLSPADILARLDDRFRLLRSGGRGGLERHQTLQATVTWSYQLLSEREQLLFDRLSVFAGSFDLTAVEVVCVGGSVAESDVVDLLAALVDKSLVTVDRPSPAVRYRLLETLRQYGEDGLDRRGELPALKGRHLGHFLAVARRTGERWSGPQGVEATATVDQEWDNFRAAHTTALALADVARAEAILDATFGPAVLQLRFEHGDWSEATAARASDTVRVGPATYSYAASFAWRAGEPDRAIDLARRGIEAAPGPDHPSTLLCWAYLVLASLVSGRFADALAAAPHLTAVAGGVDADPLHQLAASSAFLLLARIGDPAAVAAHLQRVDEIGTRAGSPPITVLASFVRGVALCLLQPPDPAGALAAYDRGLRLARDLGATHMVIGDLMGIAAIKVSASAPDAAEACQLALIEGYEARSWALLGSALVSTAEHLQAGTDREAASVIFGHLEAQHGGAVAFARLAGVARPVARPAGPDVESWQARGAAMDRHELVRYALERLRASPT